MDKKTKTKDKQKKIVIKQNSIHHDQPFTGHLHATHTHPNYNYYKKN